MPSCSTPHLSFDTLLEIPFVCNNLLACAPDQFSSWPDLQGWRWTPTLDPMTFASRLQAWLFFGLISTYTPETADRELFLTENDEGLTVVSLEKVDVYLRGKANETYDLPLESIGSLRRQRKLLDAIELARNFMTRTTLGYLKSIDDGISTDIWRSKAHAVVFATDVLIDTLDQISSLPSPNTPWLFGPAVKHGQPSLAAEVRVIRESAKRVGRCPSLAWRLRPSSLTWLQMLLNSAPENTTDHLNCPLRRCVKNDIDIQSYKTRHVDTCRGCCWAKTDQSILRDAIIEDKIPLVRCYEDRCGQIKLETVKGDLRTDFIAISHIWSGGLGNFRDNAIPYCQLRRLKTTIDNMPPAPIHTFDVMGASWFVKHLVAPVQIWSRALSRRRKTYFWLDTLCIPVADHLKTYRQQAIESMGQIYGGASKVLVLDPDLERTDSRAQNGDIQTTNLCIWSSPWMSRSWPLQEGAVPLNLFVKFKDRCILVGPDQKQSVGLPDLRMLELDHEALMDQTSEWATRSKAIRFDETWNALVTRRTTKPDDLHGILATLINLSAAEILQLPPQDRMKAIIKSQFEIPLVMLYEHGEIQSDQAKEQVSWSPQLPGQHTFSGLMNRSHGVLRVTEEGFIVSSAGRSFALLVEEGIATTEAFVLASQTLHEKYEIRPEYSGQRSKGKAKSEPRMLILSH